ncbi:MAG TPA: FtsX-like permease family protein [Micromonosporaceae bacterium]|jgi:putative ABC transport system permease protein
MLRVMLAGFRAHLARFVGTAIAVLLGVGFICGTLVFNDTASAAYYDTFARTAKGIDVAVERTRGTEITRQQLDAVSRLAVVDAVVGRMVVSLPMLDAHGRTIANFGVSGVGVNTDGDPRLRPFSMTGAVPAAPDEAMLDVNTASKQHLGIGGTITVLDASGRRHSERVVGLMDFGTSTRFSDVSVVGMASAQLRALSADTGYDEIVITARAGVSQADAAAAVRGALGGALTVETGDDRRSQLADDATSVASQFTTIVLIFGVISLIVAAFVIYNTFAILITQRMRETALLRCVGASRGQIFRTTLGEAFLVGLLGSGVGVVAGIGMTAGLPALLNTALHADIPAHTIVVRPPSILVGLAVGIVVTLVSALVPAVRATLAAPVAALREEPTAPVASRVRQAVRLAFALLIGGLGLLLTYQGSRATDAQTGTLIVVAGGVVTFLGILIAAPLYIGPLTSLVGYGPALALGAPAKLAVANSRRNPGRAAVTSATLMIGIGLMALFATLIASISETANSKLVGHYPVDYVMVGITPAEKQSQNAQNTGVPIGYAQALRARPEFSGVAETRLVPASVDGTSGTIAAIDPASLGTLVKPELATGNVGDLATGTAIVSATRPSTRGLKVGDTVTVRVSGHTTQVRVIGTGDTTIPAASEVDVVVSWDQLTALAGPGEDSTVMAKLAAGVTPTEGSDALDALSEAYPLVQVSSIADLSTELTRQVNGLIGLFAGLLGTAVLISLFGIANTLALSVIERRRESAVVRALGLTKGQLRRTLFIEAVLMAVVGALVGVIFGLLYGRLVVQEAFSEIGPIVVVPWGWLGGLIVLAAAAATGAAVLPARRAAKASLVAEMAQQ